MKSEKFLFLYRLRIAPVSPLSCKFVRFFFKFATIRIRLFGIELRFKWMQLLFKADIKLCKKMWTRFTIRRSFDFRQYRFAIVKHFVRNDFETISKIFFSFLFSFQSYYNINGIIKYTFWKGNENKVLIEQIESYKDRYCGYDDIVRKRNGTAQNDIPHLIGALKKIIEIRSFNSQETSR